MADDLVIPQEIQVPTSLLDQATAMQINSIEDDLAASAIVADTAQRISRIEAWFKPMKDVAFRSHRLLCEREKQLLSVPQEVKALLSKKIVGYRNEQERLRVQEQQRLQAEADRKTRAEREALEAKAAAAKRPETKQKYAEQAAQVMPAPVVSVASAAPKVAGQVMRQNWTYEIVDESQIPREFLVVDRVKLAGYARAMKEKAQVPGVVFRQETTLAQKAG